VKCPLDKQTTSKYDISLGPVRFLWEDRTMATVRSASIVLSRIIIPPSSFTIVLSYCHHRTVANHHRSVTIVLSRITTVLSYGRHRTAWYWHPVIIVPSYYHHCSVMLSGFRSQRKRAGRNGTPNTPDILHFYIANPCFLNIYFKSNSYFLKQL
jgi:hypothetical protein